MRRQSGFSMIELLVTLVIAAILLAMAAPSLAAFFRTNRLAAASNDLVMSLQLARAEAARRGRDVSLCYSTDGSSCSGGTNWTGGWIVFQDNSSSGAPTLVAANVIRVFGEMEPSLALTGPGAYVRFRPDGSIDWTGAASTDVERRFVLSVTGCTDNQKRQIHVTRLGRVRSAAVGCSA